MNNKIENLLSRTGDVALRRRAGWILERVIKAEPKTVLDIGCGDGFYLHLLSQVVPNAKLVGIDNDPRALKSAKGNLKKRNIKLCYGSIFKLPFKDKSFDLVIISEVLEHLEDDDKGLKEVHRILKTGGIALISVPHANYPFLWDPPNWLLERVASTHIKSGFWAGIWNQHRRLYRRHQLAAKLKANNFKNVETKLLTKYCLPFNHHLLNLAARFLVSQKRSTVGRAISKFNTAPIDDILTPGPFQLFFLLDKLNNRSKSDTGVSLVAMVDK